MVKQGVIVGEAFRREKLLGVQSTIRLTKLGMTLMRNVPHLMIIRHGKKLNREN
jgi:hypothetical protein